MKILQINAVNAIASTGRTSKEMSEELLKNDFDSVVAYSNGPSFSPENEYLIGNKIDTKIHGFMSRLTGKQGYFSRGATKKLLKFMDEYKPDVVVLRNLHGNYINLPMLLKYLAKNDIATVVVLHDCWFYTGKCCHYTKIGCYRWQNYCGNCPSLKNYNPSWFFDRTTKLLADKKRLFGAIPRLAVVGVSDWLTNEAKKSPVFENAKIITRIYNWIDTEKFSPMHIGDIRKKLSISDENIILCVANGWSSRKGLDTILALSKFLSDNEKILLIGNLKETVVLPSNIIQIPATNSVDELIQYYNLADVFVQPSLEETFGKVSAEALACGTPVVCFNSTANPELIGEGCGAVVPVGDINAMFEEVQTILKNKKAFYSSKNRDFALKNFCKHKNIQEYIQLFQNLLD